ncbi:MAG: L7Ae/L30e/S12e/Gadd45 family ribosomal protein [Candidatus Latescibacterota bacterium]
MIPAAKPGQAIIDRVGGYVGLAARARQVISGGAMCRQALNSGKGHLIVLAEDVSESIRARFAGLSQGKGVPMVIIGTKEDLGRWVGKSARSALLVRDVHLAGAILQVSTVVRS